MRCTARNARGLRCGAAAVRGSRTCFWHSRSTRALAQEARRRGGVNAQLALRPPLVPTVEGPGALQARSAGAPGWLGLATHADLLEAVRAVTRATLARRLDRGTANGALVGLQVLLGEERERRAGKRARREYAREQLRRRLEELEEEAETLEGRAPEGSMLRAEIRRFASEVEYLRRLAGRARV